MRITEMNENYEEFVSRDCINTEAWAANWVVTELLKQFNEIFGDSYNPNPQRRKTASEMTDEELESEYDNLPWKKAIFLNIDWAEE